jgi:hypothetical protein
MSRNLRTAVVGVLAIVLAGGCFGGYQLYQRRYLSSNMKRTLTAAMDPSATESDIRTYIRDARLQIHTRKDAEILQKFQTVVQLAKNSTETNTRLFNEAMHSLGSYREDYSTFDKLVELRSEYWRSHIPVPKSLQAQMDQALADVKARHKQELEIHDAEQKRADDEGNIAKKLYGELRSELGVPPLPGMTKEGH